MKAAGSPDLTAPSTQVAEPTDSAQVFRREGEYWTIAYAGTTVQLRDALGLQYVAHLLARLSQRLTVEELVAAVKGQNGIDAARARSAVGKRIRDAMRRIQEHHPALGYHLDAGIKTGAHCVYRPDPERPQARTAISGSRRTTSTTLER